LDRDSDKNRDKLILIFVLPSLCGRFGYAEEEEAAQSENSIIKYIVLSDAPTSHVPFGLGELTGKAVVQDGELKNIPGSSYGRKEISKKEAIPAIESVLALSHIAVVELGAGLLKAVGTQS
jgi:hypothetical protein